MAVSNLVAATSGLTTGRFPAAIGNPFQIPAGLTLQNTVTTTTTFTAGQLPAQVFAVIIGGGGGGSGGLGGECGGGGGGACIGWVDVPSSGITATIGAGGTAGVGSNGNGGRGGTTFFGAYAAFGGGGGIPGDIFTNHNSSPLGDGAGYGGSLTLNPTTNRYIFGPKGSPFIGGMQLPMGSTNTSYLINNFSLAIYNYNGGGAGATTVYSNVLGKIGLPGLTGGGGGPATAGGGSSRDGGVSITFAGGAHVSGNAGGGGAGLLAVGASGTTSSGGAGGSGGGGGGCGPNANSNNGGAGGAGCVLIYY